MLVIADSSPLISFAILNRLELLEKIFKNIYVPKAVYEEVTISNKPYSKELKFYLKDKVKIVKNKISVNFLNNELDRGESEAIVLALEEEADYILIDDYKGRKIADMSGLEVIGTIGVLLKAKELNYISEVKSLLDILINSEIRIGRNLYKLALKLANEIEE